MCPHMEDFYETNSVGAGRSSYSCYFCDKTIPKGSPSDVHKFYPEFASYRTHKKCSAKFLASEQCNSCCENYDPTEMVLVGKIKYCKECAKEEQEIIEKEAKLKEAKRLAKEFKEQGTLKHALKVMKGEIKDATKE